MCNVLASEESRFTGVAIIQLRAEEDESRQLDHRSKHCTQLLVHFLTVGLCVSYLRGYIATYQYRWPTVASTFQCAKSDCVACLSKSHKDSRHCLYLYVQLMIK